MKPPPTSDDALSELANTDPVARRFVDEFLKVIAEKRAGDERNAWMAVDTLTDSQRGAVLACLRKLGYECRYAAKTPFHGSTIYAQW